MKSSKKSLLLPIFLMAGPILLLIFTIFTYAMVSFLAVDTSAADPLATESISTRITNIILYLVGIVSILGIVPCFVIGVIMLIKRTSKTNQPN